MGEERGKSEYEALREARLLENKARLESLGINSAIRELQKAKKTRPYNKRLYGLTPVRRSDRLNKVIHATNHPPPPRRSRHLERTPSPSPSPSPREEVAETKPEPRPANAPLLNLSDVHFQISPEISARRCNSKGRGSVYNPVLGICCHFCRQKKLCGEEDCKRCGDCDVNQPCLGKTDCSVCHSSTGVFCRACLKIRYGEEIEEVRKNKKWMCPHCIEEKGINPYWICNSSICMRKRKRTPTGIAIYRAREMGYKSVAHLIMEDLKRGRM